MVADPIEPQGLRVPDQLAEQAMALGQRPDALAGLLVDADVDEPLELALLLVEHTDRRVAGSGQVARRLEQLREHRLEVELGDELARDREQAPKLGAVEPLLDPRIGFREVRHRARPRR